MNSPEKQIALLMVRHRSLLYVIAATIVISFANVPEGPGEYGEYKAYGGNALMG